MNLMQVLKKIEISKDLCEYWDVRIESISKSKISYEDFNLVDCSLKPSLGAFIRVYQNGMWFYSSTTRLDNLSEQIKELCHQSLNAKQEGEKVRPYNQTASVDHIIHFDGVRLDQVTLAAKKEVCESYFSLIKEYTQLKNINVNYSDEYKVKYFRSSTDVEYSYDFNQCGLMVSYSVVEGENKFDDRSNIYASSLEDLKNLEARIKATIEESLLFKNAKTISAGEYPVVMDSEVVGVFAHESFGHKSEADFMLGDADAKETWKLGKKVGNDCLSIVDYGAQVGTSGYCPIDDEGFKTQKTYLIKNGILTGRLHSQYTSQVLDEAPTGNGRAMNFEFEPIVRMTNTYVEPGNHSFEELISKVKLGIFAKDINHGSGLSTFTIAPRKCYMIRDGKIAEPVRVSVMSGTIFETLNQIEGCTVGEKIISSVFGGCGKMQQWPLSVGFGGSKVLVSKMVIS